jgi:hypothetical protein
LFLRFKYPNPSLTESDLYEKFFSDRIQDHRTVNRLINEEAHHRGRFEKALRPSLRSEQKKIAYAILCNICANDTEQFDALMNSVGYNERNKLARNTCLLKQKISDPKYYF